MAKHRHSWTVGMVKDFDPMGITQVGQSRKGTDVIRWCKRCRKVG